MSFQRTTLRVTESLTTGLTNLTGLGWSDRQSLIVKQGTEQPIWGQGSDDDEMTYVLCRDMLIVFANI